VSEDDQADLGAFDGDGDAPDAGSGSGSGARDADASDVANAAPDDDAAEITSAAPDDEATTGAAPDAGAPSLADLDRDERVELGVELLANLETDSLPLSEAVDRIETVTTAPDLTREILDTAELRGVIERAEGRLRTRRGGTFVSFDSQVVQREGDYECRRCGASLSTGHFVRFESGELGPFGPSCVRKVLGRE